MESPQKIGFSEESLAEFEDARARINQTNRSAGYIFFHLLSGVLRFSRGLLILTFASSQAANKSTYVTLYLIFTALSWLFLIIVIRTSYHHHKILNGAVSDFTKTGPRTSLLQILADGSLDLDQKIIYLYYLFSEMGLSVFALKWLFFGH